jgi:mono/diheme cytochrome c family protein
VAATGTAIANGLVALKCAAGSTATGSTMADGSFSLYISAVTLPCVARVDYHDASGAPQKLHSVVLATGNVNITPITDMVVANLSSSGIAADAFDKARAKEVAGYTPERLRTASQTVKTELQAKGVDVSHLPDDMIGTKLQAATASRKGDAHDGVLDALKLRLQEQGKTLHDLEDDMKAGHESAGVASTSTGLPGDATAGQVAYESNCQSCHGARMPDAVNAAKILQAIQKNEGGMGFLTTLINATTADNIATYMANGASTPVTVLKTQTISFASPGNQTLGSPTPTLSALASSGLPVTLVSTTPLVCSVSNTTLVLLNAGVCSLSASQDGDATFGKAAPVVNSFAVVAAGGVVQTSAINGKTLYASTGCGSCHGAIPATLRVLAGANNPAAIQNAITGVAAMNAYSSLTSQALADIAAYLATPAI